MVTTPGSIWILLGTSVRAGVLVLVATPLGAQPYGSPTPSAGHVRAPVSVRRLDSAPVIDGALDEPVWRSAARLEGFVQTKPGDNTAPSRETVVLIGLDARTLYFAIRAYDDSAAVRANMTPRDNIGDDDVVEIFLDTFGDRRHAYALAFNPLGIQADGVLTEGATTADYSVDIVMQSRGRLDREGWAVEVAIPLSSLRYATNPGQLWNVQVQRRIRHLDDEQDSWMPMRRGLAGFLTQAGSLSGFGDLPGGRIIEVIPSVAVLGEGARVPSPDPGASPSSFRDSAPRTDLGLSAKLGVSSEVNADLALNPDFAQVEADAPVVTANQRFPLFFEEKRPFFLEGVDLFRTPLQVVHTRAIVDPVAAVKLTGKTGSTAFGVLLASDEAPGLYTEAERSDTLLQAEVSRLGGRNSTVGILRLRREVGAASTIGLLATGYRFVDRDNVTLGTDTRLAIGTRLVATAELIGTWARRAFYDPDNDREELRTGRGLGYRTVVQRPGRHLNLTLSGEGRSPDYVAESGFTTQTNINDWGFEARWDAEPRPGAPLLSWSAAHTTWVEFDWQGRMKYAYLWPRATFNLRSQTSVTIGPYSDYLRLFEDEFGPRRNARQAGAFAGPVERSTVYRGYTISGSSTPLPQWTVAAMFDQAWQVFDYDFGGGPRFPRVSPEGLANPAAPLNPGPGRTHDAKLSVTWRPSAALRFGTDYTWSRLVRNDTHLLAYEENLWSSQVVYQFSRFAFARIRTDYQSSRYNLRPQLLLAWAPNPGTAFYMGYNEDLAVGGYKPSNGRRQSGVSRNSRTMFVKFSYLMRRLL